MAEKEKKFITRALDIISELSDSLDLENGGTTARQISAVYNQMKLLLWRGSSADIQEVKISLIALRDMWKEAIK